MKRVISKQVIALYPGGHLLEDQFFRDIRERYFNQDRHKQKEEAGWYQDKKNIISPTGFGPNERQHNPGVGMETGREDATHKATGVGSGYNDGGPADDEIGPGHKKEVPNPYAGIMLNELFMDLGQKSRDYDSIQGHLKQVERMEPVELPARHNVDNLVNRRRKL